MHAEFKRVKDIFLAAVEKPAGEAREAYLREACGDEGELRRPLKGLCRLCKAGLEPPFGFTRE